VTGGNHLALRKLLGQSADQTFSYDSNTIFMLWTGRVPTQISAGQLDAGAKVEVRIRAPKGSTLAQLEATAAKRVAEHKKPSATT
jgi:hypothetical protein